MMSAPAFDPAPERSPQPRSPAAAALVNMSPATRLADRMGRPLRDLRISVTDRCNFRCSYCMPRELFGPDHAFLPRPDVLTADEIVRVARVFVEHGVEKLRITGGEPLVRRDLPQLVERLAAIPGVRDLTITTNGSLLARRARELRDAGLQRVTVSLDSLDDDVFGAMNGVGFHVADVLAGIERARDVGLAPIKINTIVKRGVNDAGVLPLARYCRDHGLILRLIEFMDVGHSNGWRLTDVVTAGELVTTIGAEFPLDPLPANYAGEVASRWRYRDGAGEIGVIASISRPFCGGCTRARVSADGQLYTCLFTDRGRDLRALLRGGASDEEVARAIADTWTRRDDRYSELRSTAAGRGPRIEMNAMGG